MKKRFTIYEVHCLIVLRLAVEKLIKTTYNKSIPR